MTKWERLTSYMTVAIIEFIALFYAVNFVIQLRGGVPVTIREGVAVFMPTIIIITTIVLGEM
jgi:hypothetical protein